MSVLDFFSYGIRVDYCLRVMWARHVSGERLEVNCRVSGVAVTDAQGAHWAQYK